MKIWPWILGTVATAAVVGVAVASGRKDGEEPSGNTEPPDEPVPVPDVEPVVWPDPGHVYRLELEQRYGDRVWAYGGDGIYVSEEGAHDTAFLFTRELPVRVLLSFRGSEGHIASITGAKVIEQTDRDALIEIGTATPADQKSLDPEDGVLIAVGGTHPGAGYGFQHPVYLFVLR